jgi:putative restriction endonuclease
MTVSAVEIEFRSRLMEILSTRVAHNGGVITRGELENFQFEDQSLRLIDTSRGIWNPKSMSVTMSIVSKPNGPYDDEDIEGGLLKYRYRAGSIEGDNRKLRAATKTGIPLILLRWIAAGIYVPVFPVYVVEDDPVNKWVLVALDESIRIISESKEESLDQRAYAQRVAKVRLHQSEFRGRVMVAYDKSCAVCDLKHPELLDAAHIIPDGHPNGLPIVTNGLALCKIHHGSYDANFLGIDSNFKIHISHSILNEVDGPMLKYGIQAMHGRSIRLPESPRNQPDRDRLYERFSDFTLANK